MKRDNRMGVKVEKSTWERERGRMVRTGNKRMHGGEGDGTERDIRWMGKDRETL